MKKIFALLLSLTLVAGSMFVLASCGDNSGNGDKKAEDGKEVAAIVGEWKNGVFAYTFNEDGSGQYDSAGTIKKFTYKTDGDKVSITFEGDTVTNEFTYFVDGDKLDIEDSAGNKVTYVK